MNKPVGFIGVGTMGGPMASNLLQKGFPVTALDVNPRSVEALQAKGAQAATDASEVGRACDVVITSLPTPTAVRQVVVGPGGLASVLAPGAVVIDMSTTDPETTKEIASELAERRVEMLDAPVSGAPLKALDGTLTIMVGGDAQVLESVRPILQALGTNIFHVGPTGAGQTVKLVNNILAAVNITAVAEAFNIGVRSGLDPKVMFEVIQVSSGDSSVLRSRVPYPGVVDASPANVDFTGGFAVDLMHKDLGLALDLARSVEAPALLASLTHQLYRMARLRGCGRLDYSAILKVLDVDERGQT